MNPQPWTGFIRKRNSSRFQYKFFASAHTFLNSNQPNCSIEWTWRENFQWNSILKQISLKLFFFFFHSLQLNLSWSTATKSTQPCFPNSHGYHRSMYIDHWRNVNLFCNDVWLILSLITNPFWYRCTWLALNDYEKVSTRITTGWR